jgi:Ca2+/Na+ antiporter
MAASASAFRTSVSGILLLSGLNGLPEILTGAALNDENLACS